MENKQEISQIAPTDFPKSDLPQNDLSGWDANIHANPPRKTKSGTWALKRGNKKGFIVGQKKTEQTPLNAAKQKEMEDLLKPPVAENEPPKVVIPPEETPQNDLPNGEPPPNAADSSELSARVVASTLFTVGGSISGYYPDEQFKNDYQNALQMWFDEIGFAGAKPIVQVVVLTGVYGVNCFAAPKGQTFYQKIKTWFYQKIATFKSHKKNVPTEDAA